MKKRIITLIITCIFVISIVASAVYLTKNAEEMSYKTAKDFFKTFIVPGNHTFQVPDATTEITVTLVSGGAGGGAGAVIIRTAQGTIERTHQDPGIALF